VAGRVLRRNKINADNAVRWYCRGPTAILDQLHANAANGAKPMDVPEVAALADAVVHAWTSGGR